MKLNFNLDISDNSISITNTPSLVAQQLPFNLQNYGHFYAGHEYFTEREGLDSFLLIHTVSGSGMLKYRERDYILAPGHVVFFACNEYQYYKTGNEDYWELKWMHINGNSCRYFFDMINEDSLCIIQLQEMSGINRNFEDIWQVITNHDLNPDLKISMHITNILTELAVNRHCAGKNRGMQNHAVMLEEVISFIRRHFHEDIKIKDLLHISHTSEYHFMRLFKRYTGISAYEYITNYRINRSKQLLKDTGLAVSEIAGEVGFNNVNNYIREFKRHVGTTPLKFRIHWVE